MLMDAGSKPTQKQLDSAERHRLSYRQCCPLLAAWAHFTNIDTRN